jgi:hypothetical protein
MPVQRLAIFSITLTAMCYSFYSTERPTSTILIKNAVKQINRKHIIILPQTINLTITVQELFYTFLHEVKTQYTYIIISISNNNYEMKLLSFVDNNFYHSQLAEFRVMQELCAQR